MKYHKVKYPFESIIHFLCNKLKNIDTSKWEEQRQQVAQKRLQALPEVRVVEALREYIDALWAPPSESNRLWQVLLSELSVLDKDEYDRLGSRIKDSSISDAIADWRRKHVR